MPLPRFLGRIVDDLVQDDSLAIVARGLGVQQIVAELVRRCCVEEAPGIYLVLNVSRESFEPLRAAVAAAGVAEDSLPLLADADLGRDKRQALYATAERCVVALGCRVAVVDLLDGSLDATKIRGVILPRCHRCALRGGDSLESFVVRVLRQKNGDAWVRAVSDEPEAFIRGFARLEKTMKALELQRVALWPRFEARTAQSLDRFAPRVYELRATLSAKTKRAQLAVVVSLEACLAELRSLAAGNVDAANYNGDSTRFDAKFFCGGGYDAYARAVAGSVFNSARIAARTKQLLGELDGFREMLNAVSRYDAVAFYSLAISVQAAASGQRFPSKWVQQHAIVDELVASARERVYEMEAGGKGAGKKPKLVLEESSKCSMVGEALNDGGGAACAVVLVRDDHAAAQVTAWLGAVSTPARQALQRRACLEFVEQDNKLMRKKCAASYTTAPKPTDGEARLPAARAQAPRLSAERKALFALEETLRTDLAKVDARPCPEDAPEDLSAHGEAAQRVFVATHAQWRARHDALDEWRPDRVVLVDADPYFVRHIETHARCQRKILDVYRLVCDNSADDAAYAAALERETDAFKRLIGEKRIVLVPSKEAHRAEALRHSRLAREAASGRGDNSSARVSGKAEDEGETVIVDSREFRSALPSMLHRRGAVLVPATLVVGDYVLSSDVCVERKSVSDLHGSLQSGRLYAQAEAMQRHYATPVLLIESVDGLKMSRSEEQPDKPPAAEQDADDLPPTTSVEARLAMLAMAYPRLRFVWTRDPAGTAMLFSALKRGRKQPEIDAAMEAGARHEADDGGGRNVSAIELLLRLPGVNDRNVHSLIEAADSLKDVAGMSIEELKPLVGPANAKKLHAAFRNEFQEAWAPQQKRPGEAGWAGKGGGKRPRP
ncbi:hypothetical protein M885DRAFT_489038 [Pelagophyceae sp. CCMP2097]|nr:hypothetical protein M885DRAFT_489038 [Pelagophyceae sp. CCMP2097]